MPTTRTVSIREFREHLTKFLREAQEKNVHFVVLRHAQPVVHVTPATNVDSLEALARDIALAREEVKRGKTFSAQDARNILGI